ncbi:MAG: chaperone modulatory protein CbpM, partial [Chitinophagaceae bacterium]
EIHSPDFYISFDDLCSSADIDAEYIVELVDYDIINPVHGTQRTEWQFSIAALKVVNKATRLHRDLDIDWADIGLVLNLLDDIEQLKNENAYLKAQLNRFLLHHN